MDFVGRRRMVGQRQRPLKKLDLFVFREPLTFFRRKADFMRRDEDARRRLASGATLLFQFITLAKGKVF
jgi:hypothetical protein